MIGDFIITKLSKSFSMISNKIRIKTINILIENEFLTVNDIS